jgi:F0F1-type ATP synthase assembly protein I
MITHILALLIGFIAGALVMRKHKAKADTLEAKSKALLSALKGK